MSERILLAGCGDLGMRVAPLLLARGDEVWALRRHPPAENHDGIHWLQGDLTLAESLHVLPSGITQMVYSPTPDRRDEAAYRSIFVDGLKHLLGALDATSLRRVLLVSSSAVYRDHGDDWVDESTLPNPPGFNGRVLLDAESWLMAQAVPSIILRLAGLYGPGRLQLLDRLRAGQAKAPRTTRHWANRMHIDDAAAAVAHLLQLPEPLPLYIGADSTPLPLDVLYDHLTALLGAASLADGAPPTGIGSKRLSNERLRDSGFLLRWPDSRDGYAACCAEALPAPAKQPATGAANKSARSSS